MHPAAIMAKPMMAPPVECWLMKSIEPTKILKIPLPKPVIRKRKFLRTNSIWKLEAMIMSPKILEKLEIKFWLTLRI